MQDLGFVLAQKEVIVLEESAKDEDRNATAVTVVRDGSLNFKEDEDLYGRLRETVGKDVINGSMTAHGSMVFVNFSPLSDVEFEQRITDAIQQFEGNWGVGPKRVCSDPIESYQTGASNASTQAVTGGSGQGVGDRGDRLRALRSSITEELGREIGPDGFSASPSRSAASEQ